MKIWCVYRDYGYEGYGQPLAAFAAMTGADQYVEACLAKDSYYRPSDYDICEVKLDLGAIADENVSEFSELVERVAGPLCHLSMGRTDPRPTPAKP